MTGDRSGESRWLSVNGRQKAHSLMLQKFRRSPKPLPGRPLKSNKGDKDRRIFRAAGGLSIDWLSVCSDSVTSTVNVVWTELAIFFKISVLVIRVSYFSYISNKIKTPIKHTRLAWILRTSSSSLDGPTGWYGPLILPPSSRVVRWHAPQRSVRLVENPLLVISSFLLRCSARGTSIPAQQMP